PTRGGGGGRRAHQDGPPLVSGEELRRRLYASGGLWGTRLHVAIRCGEGPPRFRLAYMAMRNRLEVARLVLEEAACPYELEVIGFENWRDFKQRMPHGKVPVLYDFDGAGNALAEETAITQFLAKQVGLAGRSDAEEAAANSLYQLYWCTFRNNGVTHDGDLYSAPKLREFKGQSWPHYKEMHRVNNFTAAERSLAALGMFEERLAESGTGFLVGDAPTYVDLALFNDLFELAEEDNVPDFAARFGLPRLGAFLRAFEARPRIRAYLESPGRVPRYSRASHHWGSCGPYPPWGTHRFRH
ncbi:unnamed protein product, partial [Prorocentrum cordatum]